MEIIDEKDDGTFLFQITAEENRILVGIAINHILREKIERMENEHRSDRDGREVHSEEPLERDSD